MVMIKFFTGHHVSPMDFNCQYLNAVLARTRSRSVILVLAVLLASVTQRQK
jgi:hypothetical protein